LKKKFENRMQKLIKKDFLENLGGLRRKLV